MIVVVLGMHRSGTSMVANLLQALGVNMGEALLGADGNNVNGYYEDTLFLGINKEILGRAGGNWQSVPAPAALATCKHSTMQKMKTAVASKKHLNKWGFKDPRTCLTAHLWHPLLPDVRYVWTVRSTTDIEASLTRAHGSGDWDNLIAVYQQRVEVFLRSISSPVLTVDYDTITSDRQNANFAALDLCTFLNIPPLNIPQIVDRVIRFR